VRHCTEAGQEKEREEEEEEEEERVSKENREGKEYEPDSRLRWNRGTVRLPGNTIASTPVHITRQYRAVAQ
jgi:hypothetical protein